jgi:hypothetical protein
MHVQYSLFVLSAILVPLMDVINGWLLIGLLCATPNVVWVVGWAAVRLALVVLASSP